MLTTFIAYFSRFQYTRRRPFLASEGIDRAIILLYVQACRAAGEESRARRQAGNVPREDRAGIVSAG